MRESIGGISLMSIFIFFFIMITFFLTGTILYYKGYKINSQLINSLEKYEGYNIHSAEDIDRILSTIGYRNTGNNVSCGKSSGGESVACLGENSRYEMELSCSRVNKNSGSNMVGPNYYITYKAKTYIYIDLPLGMSFKIPVTAKSNPIYQFTGYNNGLGC